MVKNIFVTGDLHVGKSTLINRILGELPAARIAGFRTWRYYQNKKLEGFYLEDIRKPHDDPQDKFIGRCINENHWVSIPATFDQYGVAILEECLQDGPNLIVMDELGFFENDAMHFQNMVALVLDSKIPVLGVLKQKETPFLNKIRRRPDVRVFVVTEQNRETIFSAVLAEVRQVVCRREPERPPAIDAADYAKTAGEIFAPIYPVIARQIKDRTGINSGLCLEVGAGTGYLGIELARITDLDVYLLDQSQEMLAIAEQNVAAAGLKNRMKTVLGDVHQLPLRNQSVDLVISRGSLYFWEDKRKAFAEIYRVLAPGGMAYVGGGFGTVELKRKIDIAMQQRDRYWRQKMTEKIARTNIDYREILAAAGITGYRLVSDEANLWIILSRPGAESAGQLDQKSENY